MCSKHSGPHLLAVALLVLASVFLPLGSTGAQSERPWPVKNKLVGKDDKKSEDVSGIACVFDTGFPRACLVIDDNLQSAQLVTVKNGEIVAGKSIRLIDDRHEGKALELDGEGVAYASGFFYVIGSHGHPRDKGKKLDPVYTENGNELKPEAILPLDQTSAGLRVLIMFDGAKEGGPRAIEVAKT